MSAGGFNVLSPFPLPFDEEAEAKCQACLGQDPMLVNCRERTKEGRAESLTPAPSLWTTQYEL